MKILKPMIVAGKVTSKLERVDYSCSRCKTVMVEDRPEPDIGHMMRCPKCGWRSRRPIPAPDEVIG